MRSPVEALNAELRAADESLVGNEEILRAVLSGSGDCIKILDLSGRLQFMSEGGKRVMEVDDFAPLKGCPWPDFWVGEGNAQARGAIAAARRGETARFRGAADTAKGSPRHWDVQVSPILGADGRPTHLLSISRDVTVEWQALQRLEADVERQRLMTEEMNHRINNLLAMVSAVAAQTIRGQDIDAARKAFLARIGTLAEANKILLHRDGAGASIADVVEKALSAHRTGTGRIQVRGEAFPLPAKQALTLGLTIHELATNAAKYGALSDDRGTVEVVWSDETIDGRRSFRFRWIEQGGPPPAGVAPARKGFGTRLIQNVLAQDFGGTVSIRYEPSGMVCELLAPFDHLLEQAPVQTP